ncbi:hypothetical protein [Bradyrhizobium neotropicale]|uniref:hypothetical protein n=1 Tax=Bradyrhizobium neotropicale TaxID=1497615 RepID=UPI003908132A
MQSVQTIGTDLPQKALVCQDEAGTTFFFPATIPGIWRIGANSATPPCVSWKRYQARCTSWQPRRRTAD